MLVLGLETATAQAGIGLGGPEGVMASFHLVNEGRHAEALVPAIEFVCLQAGVELDKITVVAVDVGPGRFTGLRVGVATAKAIAFASRIPIVIVSSLEVLAFSVRRTCRRIVSIIDALSGEVYYASYRSEAGRLRQITEPRLARPEEVAVHLRSLNEDFLAIGDGAVRYADTFAAISRVTLADKAFQFPSAVALVEMASAKALQGEFASDSAVQITYLRQSYVHSKKP